MDLQIIIAVSFIILAFFISYVIQKIRNNRIQKVYTRFADLKHLSFSFDTFLFKKRPELTGKLDGFNVKVYNTSKGSIEATERYYFTLAEISIPGFNLEFEIGRENVLKAIGEVFGYQDIKIDREDLDKNFVFRSNDPEAFKSLIKQIDPKLFDKDFFGKHIKYKSGVFSCQTIGIVKNQKGMNKLDSMINICLSLAKKNN